MASSDVRPSRGSQERPGQRQGPAAAQDSDGESDDGWLRRAPGSDEIMECNRVEFNVTESLQFRKEFEAGREQAHEDTAYAEGYGYGAEELRQIGRSRTRWQSHTARRARRMACSASAKPRAAWRTNGETDAGAGLDGFSDNGEPEYSDEDK